MIGYRVILSDYKDIFTSLDVGEGFQYIDKTTDLEIKVEPEKTIDLDDGSTEVGAVKTTVSFTTLRQTGLEGGRYLHLLPVDFASGTMHTIDLKRCSLRMKTFESKTGEFEKQQFTIVNRFPVEVMEDVLSVTDEVGQNKVVCLFPEICYKATITPSGGEAEEIIPPGGGIAAWGLGLPFIGNIQLSTHYFGVLTPLSLISAGGLYVFDENGYMRKVG